MWGLIYYGLKSIMCSILYDMPSFDSFDFLLVNDARIKKKERLIAPLPHTYGGCWYNWLIKYNKQARWPVYHVEHLCFNRLLIFFSSIQISILTHEFVHSSSNTKHINMHVLLVTTSSCSFYLLQRQTRSCIRSVIIFFFFLKKQQHVFLKVQQKKWIYVKQFKIHLILH